VSDVNEVSNQLGKSEMCEAWAVRVTHVAVSKRLRLGRPLERQAWWWRECRGVA
jgi:hypothetical protein